MFFISIAIVLFVIIITTLYFSHRTRENARKEEEEKQTSASFRNLQPQQEKSDSEHEADIQQEDPDIMRSSIEETVGLSKPENYIPLSERPIKRSTYTIPISISAQFPPPVPPKPKKGPLKHIDKFSYEKSEIDVAEASSVSLRASSLSHENVYERESRSENNVFRKVSVKKLALNLKINPMALLPGSKPQYTSMTGITCSTEEPQENLISTGILTNVSKNRVRIMANRRPPSRKLRSSETDNFKNASPNNENQTVCFTSFDGTEE